MMSLKHKMTKYDVKLSENWGYVKSVWCKNEPLLLLYEWLNVY